jgi:hypothetical protein
LNHAKKTFHTAIIAFLFHLYFRANKQQPNFIFHSDYFEAFDYWVVLPEIDKYNLVILIGYPKAVEKFFSLSSIRR